MGEGEESGRGEAPGSCLGVVLEQSDDPSVGVGDSGVVLVLAHEGNWELLLQLSSIIGKGLSGMWVDGGR